MTVLKVMYGLTALTMYRPACQNQQRHDSAECDVWTDCVKHVNTCQFPSAEGRQC